MKLILIFISLLWMVSSIRADIKYGPYLQDPTQTSMYVCWVSSAGENLTGEILYGTIQFGTSDITENSLSSDSVIVGLDYQNNPQIHHRIKLSELSAETEYQYRLIHNGDSSQIFRFKTNPVTAYEDIKIALIGDSQTRSHTAAVMKALSRDRPDLILHMGDDNEWTYIEDPMHILAEVPMVGVLGNHDVDGNQYDNIYLPSFVNPAKRPIDTIPDAFAFDYAGVKILGYNNCLFGSESSRSDVWSRMTPYDSQKAFFEQELIEAQENYRFILLYGHKRVAYNMEYANDYNLLAPFLTPDNPYNIDLVANGHQHCFKKGFNEMFNYMWIQSDGLASNRYCGSNPEKEHPYYVMLNIRTSNQGGNTVADAFVKDSNTVSFDSVSWNSKQSNMTIFAEQSEISSQKDIPIKIRAYPNPFINNTRIHWNGKISHGSYRIVNPLGVTIQKGILSEGQYMDWQSKNLAAGIYYVISNIRGRSIYTKLLKIR
jgi:predicted phosphodiesterase